MEKIISLRKMVLCQLAWVMLIGSFFFAWYQHQYSWKYYVATLVAAIFVCFHWFATKIEHHFRATIRENRKSQLSSSELIALTPLFGVWFYFKPLKIFAEVEKHNQEVGQKALRLTREAEEREDQAKRKVLSLADEYMQSELCVLREFKKKVSQSTNEINQPSRNLEWESLAQALISKKYEGGVISCFKKMLELCPNESGFEDTVLVINKLLDLFAHEKSEIEKKVLWRALLCEDYGKLCNDEFKKSLSSQQKIPEEIIEARYVFLEELTDALSNEVTEKFYLFGLFEYFSDVVMRLHGIDNKTGDSILKCLILSLPDDQTDMVVKGL